MRVKVTNNKIIIIALLLFAAVVIFSPDANGGKPCAAKEFATEQVKQACDTGGQASAKKLMKGVVKKARSQGTKLKCGSCHSSTKTFELKPGAIEDLKNLL